MILTFRKPFPLEMETIIRSSIGDFAHENFPETRHATDFKLPIGCQVLAARDGIVHLAKYDSIEWYPPISLVYHSIEDMARLAQRITNFVAIEHGGNILTEYVHLATSPVVEEGQEVQEGDLIGYIGLSGLLSMPHLHFNPVMKTPEGFRSVPYTIV